MYRAQVVIAYGEDNALCAPSLPMGCSPSASYSAVNFINRPDVTCKPGNGNQYCAVSRLTATCKACSTKLKKDSIMSLSMNAIRIHRSHRSDERGFGCFS